MAVDLEKHRPLARLLIRLMGLFFMIEGGTGVVSNGVDVFFRTRAYQQQGYAYQPETSLAWAIGSVCMLVAGIYLAFKGTAALDLVFHESLSKPAVPCPDCGYDLRGQPETTECPECGHTLRSEDAAPK